MKYIFPISKRFIHSIKRKNHCEAWYSRLGRNHNINDLKAKNYIHWNFYSTKAKESKEIKKSTRLLKVWELPSSTNNDSNAVEGRQNNDHQRNVKKLYVASQTFDKNKPTEKYSINWIVGKDNQPSKNVSLTHEISDTLRNHHYYYLLKHFLPYDYPKSVSGGYAKFASYSFIASICGSAAMVLSTQSLLIAVGVGSASAAPVAGTLNWVMKDGIGQLGGVLFASRITSNETGNTIDKDPKRWRMVSALSMDGATLLEILSPLVPGYFLLVASIANVAKNIGFLTAGASRAALHQSLAMKDNLGDITAKAGSQGIAASLIGTTFGIGLSPLMGGDPMNVMLGFIYLSSIHQYCTYKSLKAVTLNTFNRHRLLITLNLYTRNITQGKDEKEVDKETLLSPESVSKYEAFMPFFHSDDSHKWLDIGCPLLEIAPTPAMFSSLTNFCLMNEKYLLNCEIDVTDQYNIKMKRVMLTFHHNATDIDVIRGVFHAHLLHSSVKGDQFALFDKILIDDIEENEIKFNLVGESYKLMNRHFDILLNQIKKWEITRDSVKVESTSSVRLKIMENG